MVADLSQLDNAGMVRAPVAQLDPIRREGTWWMLMARNKLLDILSTFSQPWPYTDPKAFAQGMGTAPSQEAAQIGANFLPGIGDAVGFAQDVGGMYTNPQTRTPLNGLLALAAMAPGIPRSRSLKGAWKAFSSDESMTTAQDLLRFVRGMDTPSEGLLRAANNYENALKTDMEWAGRWDIGPEEDAFIDAVRLAAQGTKKSAKGQNQYRRLAEADLRRAIERGDTHMAELLRKDLAGMDQLSKPR